MRLEFLHLADLHLGYRQYGHLERFHDFGRAFLHAVDYALAHHIPLVLISGDLFHKSAIDPATLLQAVDGLRRLRQAGTVVTAVAGNHDRARYRDRLSWLHLLNELDYLRLLAPAFADSRVLLERCTSDGGAYTDLDNLRVFGLPYLGASTRSVLAELPAALEQARQEGVGYVILMAHLGLEGEMPGVPGGIPEALLSPLKEHVDYLALGHWHKPFERDGWIYNPGSPENCSLAEAHWRGGFYHVVVGESVGSKHEARHVEYTGRPFVRLAVRVDDCSTPDALYDAVRQLLHQHARKDDSSDLAPVLELRLEGVLGFDRRALDLQFVGELMQSIVSPLVALPKDNTRSVDSPISSEVSLSRSELERTVMVDLVRRDGRYGAHAGQWADLVREIKAMVLGNGTPEAMVSTMEHRIAEMSEE